MNNDLDPVAQMLAEWSCQKLNHQFAILNDDRDHEGLARLFTLNASFARPLAPDSPIVGRDAILAMFRDRPPRLSRHIITNSLIEVMSATEARGRCYITLYSTADVDSARPALAEPSIFVGQYDDRYVCEDGRWLYSERRGSAALKT